MHNDEDLDRYLLGEMDESEKRAFDDKLTTDTALADAVVLHQDTIAGIRLDSSLTLKKHLQEVEASLAGEASSPATEKKKSTQRPLVTWLALAASLLSVMLLGYLFLPGTSPEDMYAAYYEPYPNLINPAQRSAEIREETVLEQAMRAYDSQQYMQALALFEQGDAVSNPGYTFYYGVSYLGGNQPERAIPLLERVADQPDSLFYHPAKWYLALAHLKTKNTTAALPYLKQLSAAEGDYVREAQELLEELE